MSQSLTHASLYRPSAAGQAVIERLQASYRALEGLLEGAIPDCHEKVLARRALRDAAQWSTKAVLLSDPQTEKLSGRNPARSAEKEERPCIACYDAP